MTRRVIRTDRLILVLGVLVLLLGGLSAWVVIRNNSLASEEARPEARALRQLRENLGPSAELRHTQVGKGLALCGYAGLRGDPRAVAFVSRPRRLLMEDDPLPREFAAMVRTDCPGFLQRRPTAAVP